MAVAIAAPSEFARHLETDAALKNFVATHPGLGESVERVSELLRNLFPANEFLYEKFLDPEDGWEQVTIYVLSPDIDSIRGTILDAWDDILKAAGKFQEIIFPRPGSW